MSHTFPFLFHTTTSVLFSTHRVLLAVHRVEFPHQHHPLPTFNEMDSSNSLPSSNFSFNTHSPDGCITEPIERNSSVTTQPSFESFRTKTLHRVRSSLRRKAKRPPSPEIHELEATSNLRKRVHRSIRRNRSLQDLIRFSGRSPSSQRAPCTEDDQIKTLRFEDAVEGKSPVLHKSDVTPITSTTILTEMDSQPRSQTGLRSRTGSFVSRAGSRIRKSASTHTIFSDSYSMKSVDVRHVASATPILPGPQLEYAVPLNQTAAHEACIKRSDAWHDESPIIQRAPDPEESANPSTPQPPPPPPPSCCSSRSSSSEPRTFDHEPEPVVPSRLTRSDTMTTPNTPDKEPTYYPPTLTPPPQNPTTNNFQTSAPQHTIFSPFVEIRELDDPDAITPIPSPQHGPVEFTTDTADDDMLSYPESQKPEMSLTPPVERKRSMIGRRLERALTKINVRAKQRWG